ncbi:hypothetical protein V1460_28040 [Streptomyces sp. SCSIO 30461]|uniref:hypothetical protein n=1 Tax=Streptomyces sp. SCSIO 30461 TaxID=3118085 RepID=UPI0030CBC83B
MGKWRKAAALGAAALTLGIGAPTAAAASHSFPWTANGFTTGNESRRWDSLGGNTQTQYSCTRSFGGRGGTIVYELYQDKSWAPDPKQSSGWFECSLTDQTKSWAPSSKAKFYWKLGEVPGGCLSTPTGACPIDMTGRTAYTTS